MALSKTEESPWRKTIPISWDKDTNVAVMTEVLTQHSALTSLKEEKQRKEVFTVFFCGPLGHGKSSIVNGLYSAIENEFSNIAKVGTVPDRTKDETQTYNCFQPRLPFITENEIHLHTEPDGPLFCLKLADFIGLRDKDDPRVEFKFQIERALRGELRDGQKADRMSDVFYTNYAASCVVWVADIMSSKEQIGSIKAFQSCVKKLGIPQILALTKCDQLEEEIGRSPRRMYFSPAVHEKVIYFSKILNMPQCRTFPIKNYMNEMEATPKLTYQYLFMLKHILQDIDSSVAMETVKTESSRVFPEIGTDTANEDSEARVPQMVEVNANSGTEPGKRAITGRIIPSQQQPKLWTSVTHDAHLQLETEIGPLDCLKIQNYINNKQEQNGPCIFLQWIVNQIENKYPDVHRIFPGYEASNRSELVFLVMTEDDKVQRDMPSHFGPYKLLSRKVKQVSPEAEDVIKMEAKMEEERKLVLSLETRQNVRSVIAKHSTKLMRMHSNLQIMSASAIKSLAFDTAHHVKKQACIVMYVPVKGFIPFGEQPFPQTIGGFKTDVREGYFETTAGPEEYHENLLMGCQIASSQDVFGTLGAFVNLPESNIGCLSCWHIFTPGKNASDCVNLEVFQPKSDKKRQRIGRVENAIFEKGDDKSVGVDAVLIAIERHRHPEKGGFPSISDETAATGFSAEKPLTFNTGDIVRRFEDIPRFCNVVKYGMKTRITRGVLGVEGTGVRLETFEPKDTEVGNYELHQQLEVRPIYSKPFEPFSECGDSGALVMVVEENGGHTKSTALGLVVGITSYNSTIVTPIWAILERFNLPPQLHCFRMATDILELREDMKEL